MPIQIAVKPKFAKQFKKLKELERINIQNAIDAFQKNMGDFDVCRIQKDLWRLKVGKWRVFFTFEKDVVTLLTVVRRASKTYKKR